MAQTNSVKLPYYAAVAPRPLPTEVEINDASNIAPESGGRRIVGIGPHFIVKFGAGVDLIEGENMLFVQEETEIPVPRVYALYSKAGKNYIIMERIEGKTLSSTWQQLSALDRKCIVQTLRSYFDELRALPAPSYYGSLGERPLLDGVFWTPDPVPAINGPFNSEESLIEAFVLKYGEVEGRSVHRAEFYRQCLPHVLGGHRPTFSHGDFQGKNILIRKISQDGRHPTPRLWQVVILDWEKSGWYPSYWEYCLAYCALRWDSDWCLWLQEVLDPYVPESAWFYAIRLDLWS